jgi:hypothetical protein
LAELSGVSIFEFLWTVQDIPASILLIPPEHFRIWNGQCGQGKPGLGPSSVHNGHAFLDEWSANGKWPNCFLLSRQSGTIRPGDKQGYDERRLFDG